MKIIWIVNIILPEAAIEFGLPSSASGGWLTSAKNNLIESEKDLELCICTSYYGDVLKKVVIDHVTYYLLPTKNMFKYDNKLEEYWSFIYKEFEPDLCHIHGTEFAHALPYIKVNGVENVIVSIQGLVSVISRYYLAGISITDFFRCFSLRDLIKIDSLWKQKASFEKRGRFEIELLRCVNNVIGRTEWDRIHTLNINNRLTYYYCSEELRSEFLSHKWSYSNCIPCRIFISQGNYPLKGLHKLLMAINLLVKDFPNISVYVAGENILKKDLFRLGGYGKYIKFLIKKYKLEQNIFFTGNLSVYEMIEEYKKCNVFVSCSSIENSSNSIKEASFLGVPIVASDVGGSKEMIINQLSINKFYRFEEHEIMAKYIREVFESKEHTFGLGLKKIDLNKREDFSDLYVIYKNMLNYE